MLRTKTISLCAWAPLEAVVVMGFLLFLRRRKRIGSRDVAACSVCRARRCGR